MFLVLNLNKNIFSICVYIVVFVSDGRSVGRMGAQTDRQLDGGGRSDMLTDSSRTDGGSDARAVGRSVAQPHGRTDGWMDGQRTVGRLHSRTDERSDWRA